MTSECSGESYNDADFDLASELFEKFYEDLKLIACVNRRRRRVSDTFETVEILHDAYFKIAAGQNRVSDIHFKSIATLAIRQVIIDHARKKMAQKRGGGLPTEALDDVEAVLPEFSETAEEIVQLSQLMEELEQTNKRWQRILDARFFAGMTEEETAEMLNLNVRTIRRDWKALKEWLAPRMGIRPDHS